MQSSVVFFQVNNFARVEWHIDSSTIDGKLTLTQLVDSVSGCTSIAVIGTQ